MVTLDQLSPQQIAATKKKLKELGIDMATLEKVAKVIEEQVPELKPILEEQCLKEGSESNINKIYKEVEDIFDHNEDTPDGDKKE